MLWNDLSRRMPALLMTMSTLPNASTALCTMAAPPSGVATESVFATASPPAAWISSTTSWAAPLSLPVPSTAPPRSFTTMSAPRLAIISACCLPRPPPAPVMIATLPSNPRSVMADNANGATAPTGNRHAMRLHAWPAWWRDGGWAGTSSVGAWPTEVVAREGWAGTSSVGCVTREAWDGSPATTSRGVGRNLIAWGR